MILDRTMAPEVRPFGKLNMLPERQYVLDNGITVHIVNHKEQDVTRITFMWQGGCNDVASPAQLGLAISMIREGNESMTSAQISEKLDFNGAWLVPIAIGSHYSGLALFTLNSKLREVLPVIIESIQSATFPEKEFGIVRERALRKLELNMKKVIYLSMRDNSRMVFGENHPAVDHETPEKIAQIEIEQAKSLQRRLCVSSGCHVYVAGNVTEDVESFVVSQILNMPTAESMIDMCVEPLSPEAPGENLIDVPTSMQSAINMSFPTDILRSHPDYIPLRLSVMALGGYFGSRLMANVREDKGYTYGIQAGLMGTKEGSYVSIITQTNNSYVRPLIQEVVNEIDRLSNEPMDSYEMDRMLRFATSQLAETLDSPFAISDYYINQLVVDTPVDYFNMQQEAIANITPEIIMSMMRKYVQPGMARTSIVGAVAQM